MCTGDRTMEDRTIPEVEIEFWRLDENHAGRYRLVIYITGVDGTFGGDSDQRRLFNEDLEKQARAALYTCSHPYIATLSGDAEDTIESAKAIRKIIYNHNTWVGDENRERDRQRKMVRATVAEIMYPVSELRCDE